MARPERTTGIAFDGDRVLVAELTFGEGALRVRAHELETTPWFRQGKAQLSEVAAPLSRLLTESEAKQVGLGALSVPFVMRTMEVPWMPDAEIRSFLEGEAQQYVVFGGERVYVDFTHLTEKEGAGGALRVLAAMARADVIDEMTDLVSEASDVRLFGVPYLFVAQFAALWSKVKAVMGSLVVGAVNTYIFIMEEGRVLFVRELDLGDQDWKEGKREDLLREIESTIRFFEDQNEKTVGHIQVLSNELEKAEIADMLQDRLGVEVEGFTPWDRVVFEGEETEAVVRRDGLLGLSALALAWLVSQDEKVTLNLLSLTEKTKQKIKSFAILTLAPLPAIVLLAFLAGMLYGGQVRKLEKQEKELAEQIQAQQAPAERAEALKQEVAALREEITRLKVENVQVVATYEASGLSALMLSLQGLTPASAWLTEVSFDQGVLSIQGYTIRQAAVGELLTNLQKTGSCEKIQLTSMEESLQEGVHVYNFVLNCVARVPQT